MVALSTTQVEYIAFLDALKEVIWLCRLLQKLELRDVLKPSPDLHRHYEDDTMKQWEPLDYTKSQEAPISFKTS